MCRLPKGQGRNWGPVFHNSSQESRVRLRQKDYNLWSPIPASAGVYLKNNFVIGYGSHLGILYNRFCVLYAPIGQEKPSETLAGVTRKNFSNGPIGAQEPMSDRTFGPSLA